MLHWRYPLSCSSISSSSDNVPCAAVHQLNEMNCRCCCCCRCCLLRLAPFAVQTIRKLFSWIQWCFGRCVKRFSVLIRSHTCSCLKIHWIIIVIKSLSWYKFRGIRNWVKISNSVVCAIKNIFFFAVEVRIFKNHRRQLHSILCGISK